MLKYKSQNFNPEIFKISVNSFGKLGEGALISSRNYTEIPN